MYFIADGRTSVAVSPPRGWAHIERYLCARNRDLAGLASHTSISPHPDDRLAPRAMDEVADPTIGRPFFPDLCSYALAIRSF